MNRLSAATVAFLLFLAAPLLAQQPPQQIYAESFRQGTTQVTELSFEAKLSPKDSTYRERIKDTHGVDRYVLNITPQGPEGDTKITSWQVRLSDLRHTIYSNVLLVSQDTSLGPKNDPGWLNPEKYAAVSIKAKRIIKVDSFYVTLEVKAYHFTPTESPYLDSMTVQIDFSNSDPRSRPSP
jgi:hypothetical protein